MAACSGCGRVVATSVALCPSCGAVRRGAGAQPTSRRLYYALAVAVVLGGAALLAMRPKGRRAAPVSACRGGTIVGTDRVADDATAPRDNGGDQWQCLHFVQRPELPFVELAKVRHRGNGAYMANNARPEHTHDPVCRAVTQTGANAFFDEPATLVGKDLYEQVSHAIYLYVGSTPPNREAAEKARRGCLITGVVAGSSAERAGLRGGDLLLKIAGIAPSDTTCDSMVGLLDGVTRGGRVEVEVRRGAEQAVVALVRPPAGLYGYRYLPIPVLP